MGNGKEAQKHEKLQDEFLDWVFKRYTEHHGYGPSKLEKFEIPTLYGPEVLPHKFLITEGRQIKTRTRELLESLSQRGFIKKDQEGKYFLSYKGYKKATGGFSFKFKRCINKNEPYFVFFSFILLFIGTIVTLHDIFS